MKIIGYSIAIISFLSIFYQVVLMVLYLKPFILDSILKRKKSWNPYYDPTFTILFSCFFIITIGFTYILVSDNEITDYSIIIYAILILFVNTFFSLIFFNRKRLIQRKTIEQIQYELDEQKEIEQLEFKQHLDIDNQNPPKKIRLVDVEVIAQNLEKIVKTNSEEIVEKLKPKKSIKINSDTINYNSCFSEKQLEHLWSNLRKYKVIHEDFLVEEFIKSFLIDKISVKMDSISLYWFHKEINKLMLDKISLTSFVTYFKNEQNKNFVEGTVRNGIRIPEHKLEDTFKDVFNDFPE